ncbi:MAG: hypothetical protein LAQ30_10765 [Acidobacteriia bacterium]|nr:hypothetical protein [Terriglobia bacterium]
MKVLRFARAFPIVSAFALAAVLVTASFAQPSPLIVTSWGQSEINEDGNLRFRVTASAGGISWDLAAYPDVPYLQLWAYIVGPASDPIDRWELIKSKAAYDKYGQPARSISGTSARFKLPRGAYTYYLFVALTDVLSTSVPPPQTALVMSDPHPLLGRTVTLP